MTVKPKASWILGDDCKILRSNTKPLVLPLSSQDQEYINKMINYIDACYNNEAEVFGIKEGMAVAANQVGYDKSVIYVHFDDVDSKEQKYLLANPKIVSHSIIKSYLSTGEGCLSVNDEHQGYVPRYKKIKVKAFDLFSNQDIEIVADGLFSICLQHEIDHLSGILYYDHINQDDPYYTEKEWIKY